MHGYTEVNNKRMTLDAAIVEIGKLIVKELHDIQSYLREISQR